MDFPFLISAAENVAIIIISNASSHHFPNTEHLVVNIKYIIVPYKLSFLSPLLPLGPFALFLQYLVLLSSAVSNLLFLNGGMTYRF